MANAKDKLKIYCYGDRKRKAKEESKEGRMEGRKEVSKQRIVGVKVQSLFH